MLSAQPWQMWRPRLQNCALRKSTVCSQIPPRPGSQAYMTSQRDLLPNLLHFHPALTSCHFAPAAPSSRMPTLAHQAV